MSQFVIKNKVKWAFRYIKKVYECTEKGVSLFKAFGNCLGLKAKVIV